MISQLEGFVRLCRANPGTIARFLATDLDAAQLEALAAELLAAGRERTDRGTQQIRLPLVSSRVSP